MRMTLAFLFAAMLTFASVTAQVDDGFQRERRGESGAAKDQLEGKSPPDLVAENWLNSKAVDLAALKGKVVVLDFWGTW
ncbi:MAG: hypothetical protein KDB53_04775 [Planctomycetes bacterium]|nr:hypothetical protein [Planctomycetota bacterium]